MTERAGRGNNPSPPSKIAKEQSIAGAKSGPQEGREEPRVTKQPPQTSNRRGARNEHEAKVRKGYEAARNPEAQGDGDPGPDQLKKRSGLRGQAGRAHTGRAAAAADVTERAQQGTPADEHTREGRQQVPGDRDPVQPS